MTPPRWTCLIVALTTSVLMCCSRGLHDKPLFSLPVTHGGEPSAQVEPAGIASETRPCSQREGLPQDLVETLDYFLAHGQMTKAAHDQYLADAWSLIDAVPGLLREHPGWWAGSARGRIIVKPTWQEVGSIMDPLLEKGMGPVVELKWPLHM
jgi:hypothetical protein